MGGCRPFGKVGDPSMDDLGAAGRHALPVFVDFGKEGGGEVVLGLS